MFLYGMLLVLLELDASESDATRPNCGGGFPCELSFWDEKDDPDRRMRRLEAADRGG